MIIKENFNVNIAGGFPNGSCCNPRFVDNIFFFKFNVLVSALDTGVKCSSSINSLFLFSISKSNPK